MPNDLEKFITDSEPSGTPSPSGTLPPAPSIPGGSPILDFYNQKPDPKPLSYAVSTGRQTPVDSAAQVINLERQTGLPTDLIKRDPQQAQSIAASKDFDAAQYQADHPVVSQWLKENPDHASLAQNDLEHLGYM